MTYVTRIVELTREEIDRLFYAANHLYGSEKYPDDAHAGDSFDLAIEVFEEIIRARMETAWGIAYWQGVGDEATSQDWTNGTIPPGRVNPYRRHPLSMGALSDTPLSPTEPNEVPKTGFW